MLTFIIRPPKVIRASHCYYRYNQLCTSTELGLILLCKITHSVILDEEYLLSISFQLLAQVVSWI